MKTIDIKLTYNCNNNCLLCCQDDAIKNIASTLKTEEVIDILEKNYQRFIIHNEETKLVISGGEPTLHDGLMLIIERAKKLGYSPIQLQTNATKLKDKEYTKKLIDLGVTSFGISLHGVNADTHEAFTKTKSSFNDTIVALQELKKYDVQVAINVVVSKLNVHQLKDIVKFIDENKFASSVQLAFIHITGRASTHTHLVAKISETAEIVKDCFRLGEECGISITSEAIPFCLLNGYEKRVSELYFNDEVIVNDLQGELLFSKLRKNQFKQKCENCKNCIFYNLCEGPWEEYPQIFGWEEFIPVKEF